MAASSRRRDVTITCLCLAVFLQVGVAVQRFELEPSDTQTIQGQTAILRCTIVDLQGQVQWTKNGFGLGHTLENYPRYSLIGSTQMGEYNLVISNANLGDDAVYECQATATAYAEGLRSRPAKVTVLSPCETPVVEGGLPIDGVDMTVRQRVEVVADMPYNLTCIAPRGRPAANVTWYQNDVLAAGETFTSVSVKDKLENSTVALNITAKRFEKLKYECRAINAAMNKAKTAVIELDVLYAPVLSINVDPIGEVREDGSVQFKCSASANPSKDIVWKWYVDGKAVPGATKSSYRLDAVGRQHHGKKVSCEAENKVGATRSEYLLSVRYSPQFKEVPRHAEIDLGDDAVLTCEVDSNPGAYIVWRRKNDPKKTIISRDKQLVVTQVSPAQLGVYTCSASVPDFTEIQAEIHILKKGPPSVVSSPEQAAKFGSQGTVECRIHAVPVGKVTWSRDNKPLSMEKLERYDQREDTFPGGVVSFLDISSVQDSDYGEFNCSMETAYGSDVLTITLSKQAVIPIAYILACLLVGVVLIIVISVGIFVYHRRKKSSLAGEGSSENSEDSTKKAAGDLTSSSSSPYKPYVDTWRPELEPGYYRQSADYDELSYPAPRDGRRSANPYDVDYPDSYGNYGYERDHRRDYGTYPGPAGLPSRHYNPRYETAAPYGPAVVTPAEYGTYGRPPSRQTYAPVTPAVHNPNRLATNV